MAELLMMFLRPAQKPETGNNFCRKSGKSKYLKVIWIKNQKFVLSFYNWII